MDSVTRIILAMIFINLHSPERPIIGGCMLLGIYCIARTFDMIIDKVRGRT